MFTDSFLSEGQASNPATVSDSTPLLSDYENANQPQETPFGVLKLPLDISFDYTYYVPDLNGVRESGTEDGAFYPSVITYGLTFGLGLAGNLLVVVALFLDRKDQGVTSAFLVSLAFADILFLLICVPYELVNKFLFHWVGGRALCKVAGFTEMLTGFASVLNLTAVSAERSVIYYDQLRDQ